MGNENMVFGDILYIKISTTDILSENLIELLKDIIGRFAEEMRRLRV